jgi:plasmid stabilization system protein ParE
MDYKLKWTEEAVSNLESILDYLMQNWTQREIANFKIKLSKQLDLILQNPFMFPKSLFQPRLRKAVLSKQTTIFYEVKNDVIYLSYLFINRMNIEKIK